MIDPEKTIRPVMVGNRFYPRYAVAINRSPFAPRLYWTGTGGDCWTADSSRARKWAGYGEVLVAIHAMEMARSDDFPGGT
jgi:hypothetical protein